MNRDLFKAFSNSTQLFGIVLEGAARAKRALIALPPEAGLGRAFAAAADDVALWSHDWTFPEGFQTLPPQGPFDLLVFYLPKARDYQAFSLELALARLDPDARVIVAGSKQAGTGSAKELLQDYLGPEIEKHSARHCVAWDGRWQAVKPLASLGATRRREFSASAWGVSARLCSYPGVFSHGRLDEGTQFLLENFQIKAPQARILDWGCGSGVLGILAKLALPEAKVSFADAHAMALESTRESLAANHVEAEAVIASDGWSQISGNFDLILSNPPAHRGIDTDLNASETFLAQAAGRLNPGGRLVMVANAHLPYFRVLNAVFKKTALLEKNTRFQVIEATL
jgi:16S rRNA (guanine1207-N2)-methyltransferase